MMRSAAGVLAGFVLWSVLWLVYNNALKKAHVLTSDMAEPISDARSLLLLLFGSIVMSAVAGYCCAAIVQSPSYNPIAVLGLLLLAVGIFFQMQYWRLMPLWYHLSFLVLLIPLCFVGALLRSAAR